MSSITMPPIQQVGLFFEKSATHAVRLNQIGITLVWLATTVIGSRLTPSSALHGTHQELGLPPCPSVMLFDRPCPGCGLTTSWTALIHGNLPLALKAHPLGPLLYVGFTVIALLSLLGLVRGWRVRSEARWFQVIATAIFSMVLIFGITRFATTPHYGTAFERGLMALER